MCNKNTFQSKTNRLLANRCRELEWSLRGREWGRAGGGPKLEKFEKDRGKSHVACK